MSVANAVKRIPLNHDAPDGSCCFSGCQFQAEKIASWMNSDGLNSAPLCMEHIRLLWERTVPCHSTRDSFTLWPLGTDI